ncbi:hypothetical protein ACIQX3_07685 [Peribacillus frigoritolerans]
MEAYMLPLVPYSVANRYEAVMTVWRELSYLYKKPWQRTAIHES